MSSASRGTSQSAPAVAVRAKRMADRLRQYYRLGQGANASDKSCREFAEVHAVSEHLMRKLKRFVCAYSPDELEDLCSNTRPNGLPLQWGHVNYLLSIHDKKRRGEMQQRATANGWTAPQLNAAIRKKFGTEKGHGRPMTRPTSLAAGLQQLMAEAEIWIRRCEVVVPHVQDMARPSRELRQQATEAVEVLQKIKQVASLAKRRLAALLADH